MPATDVCPYLTLSSLGVCDDHIPHTTQWPQKAIIWSRVVKFSSFLYSTSFNLKEDNFKQFCHYLTKTVNFRAKCIIE